ncbi:hypothetical protein HanIR_Chr07g0308491 [Helianthus annuus]|nr:hypothetical protein HanIR_Chr07g0308491 [Helianthus annuus]
MVNPNWPISTYTISYPSDPFTRALHRDNVIKNQPERQEAKLPCWDKGRTRCMPPSTP